MLKKGKLLLPMLGLMLSFCLCNYVFAQEIRPQCNEGCTNKTFNMTGYQIKKLFGPESGGEYRYGIYATLKSDQLTWKYSEDNLTLESFAPDGGFVGYDCGDCHVPRFDKEEDIVAWCDICKSGWVWLDFYYLIVPQDLPGQPIVSIRRENLTNMKIVIKFYKYQPEKEHKYHPEKEHHGFGLVVG
jgi:hypothetical protein